MVAPLGGGAAVVDEGRGLAVEEAGWPLNLDREQWHGSGETEPYRERGKRC